MPIIIPHDSEWGKELAKWEQHRTKYVGDEQQPGNPYTFRPYPMALYRAAKTPNGKVVCMQADPDPVQYPDDKALERAQREVAAFNQRCFMKVGNDEEERRAKNDGWRNTPAEALAQFEAREQEIARASAEALHAAQGMSGKAKDELAAAGEETHEHVTDVKGGSKQTPKFARS